MRLRHTDALVLLCITGQAIAAIGPTAELVISNKMISPDGFPRLAVVAGGTLPGPLIKGQKGANFKINVIDQLTDTTLLNSTSIHWHGMYQKGTNWADGPAFVNQCPISTGNSFRYEFSAGQQTNTFWYHSHLGVQYCDGLRGPLVIYDPSDPYKHLYDVDDETTIISLIDWYHTPAPILTGPPPTPPDSVLINGLGRYSGGPASPLSIVNVQHGKRYRMRLISMACIPNFIFSIDDHTKLTVIEADGQPIRPHVVDSIQIYAGQRYSFVIEADQPVGNYWVRAIPNLGYQGFDSGMNSAILRYKGAPSSDPATPQRNSTYPLLETDLVPLTNPPAPGRPYIGGADVHLNMNMGYDPTTKAFLINGVPFTSPNVPVLLQIMSGAQNAQDLLPKGSVYSLPSNKVIEISLPPGDTPGGPASFPIGLLYTILTDTSSQHPFHLHGHQFSVVRSAGSNTTNFINPVQRDTVNTGGPGDNVTIRFVTDNSGPWFLHCHIEFHLDHGLAVVLVDDAAHVNQKNPTPAAWDQLCPIYDKQLGISNN